MSYRVNLGGIKKLIEDLKSQGDTMVLRYENGLDINSVIQKQGLLFEPEWIRIESDDQKKHITFWLSDEGETRIFCFGFPEDKLFKINRTRAWKIIKAAAKKAGIMKPVYPHLLRHSDAIERLRQTGNPKALQIHLGHESPLMTMRYLFTLTAEDALRIQQEVEF